MGQVASALPEDPTAPATGLGARLVGNLRGLLRGSRATVTEVTDYAVKSPA